MKITGMTAQTHNPDRINIMIDGAYRLSLTVQQVVDHKLAVGRELDEPTLDTLTQDARFGKLYMQTLAWVLMRPRSRYELEEYLYKKTRPHLVKRRNNEVVHRDGIAQEIANRVSEALVAKGYVDDGMFARFWIEHRKQKSGVSFRKLRAELAAKRVDSSIVNSLLDESDRNDHSELQKMIARKYSRYSDSLKLKQYLARQGFSYQDITDGIKEYESNHSIA